MVSCLRSRHGSFDPRYKKRKGCTVRISMAALLILSFLGFDKWWFIRDRHRNLGGETYSNLVHLPCRAICGGAYPPNGCRRRITAVVLIVICTVRLGRDCETLELVALPRVCRPETGVKSQR